MVSLYGVVRGIARATKEFPPIRALREFEYGRRFASEWPGTYQGVYGTFAAAIAAAPRTMKVGYDQPELAAMYRDRMKHAMPSDYPVLFWLNKLLRPDTRVFDYGGHVGVSFHCFERYLGYPPGLLWTVCDVPAVVASGESLARERGKQEMLRFTTRFADADGCDLLLAAGSLQYVEEHVWTSLARLTRRPKHLLISKLPLHDGPTFVTLQNTGNAYHAYRISNRAEFERGVTSAGYRKIDDWTNAEQSCHVPFRGGATISAYAGYLFEAA